MKEYIEREKALEITKRTSGDYATAFSMIRQLPVADIADFDVVDEILKKHRAFVMATINGHGCHIGTYKKISLEADGDWIIEVDVESLSVTGQGNFAPVVHGRWKLHDNGSGTCSECHFTQKHVWDYDNWQNYCGVCGAKMDLEPEV